MKKERIVSLDLVRLVSCLCVMIVHFNAAVCGWRDKVFLYPNNFLPNYLFGERIYIGSIGVSLFFMLSGMGLMRSYQPGKLAAFYKKRLLAIFPMFYAAYFCTTVYDFFLWKGISDGSLRYLVFSFLGMDGYLADLGWIPYDFYQVGEWFLGCLLLIYLLFPLLYHLVDRWPIPAFLVSCLLFAGYSKAAPAMGIEIRTTEVILRLPELIMGMLFTKFDLRRKPKLLLGITAAMGIGGVLLMNVLSAFVCTTGISAFIGTVLMLIGERISSDTLRRGIVTLAGLTYPVFLIHHWLIDRMVMDFDLADFGTRNSVFMFLLYLIFTFTLAWVLRQGTAKLMRKAA